MKLSIVIPVYNEIKCFNDFWLRFRATPFHLCHGITDVEIIIVDDGSSDGTTEFLRTNFNGSLMFNCGFQSEVKLLCQPTNEGKGAAVRRGIDCSTGDIVLIQDFDMEYFSVDYPLLLAPIIDNFADAVFGTRLNGSTRHVHSFRHAVGNRFITFLFNLINDLDLTDMEAGYKVVRGQLMRSLNLKSKRFGIEPELASRLRRAKARIFEVPIHYMARSREDGKKLSLIRDGSAAFFHILRFGIWDRKPFRTDTIPSTLVQQHCRDLQTEQTLLVR